MKKLLILLVTLVVCASTIIGCAQTTPTPTAPATKQAPHAPRIPIDVTGTTSKSYYLSGEYIDIKISFKGDPGNMTKEPFEINPFPPAITVKLRGPHSPSQDDESVRSFPAGTATRRLEPGEVVNYDLTWNQRNDQGQPVHYGYYYLSLGPIAYGETGRIGPFSLSWFPILPAEGVLEKTIEVNQSQTVNGITIKLERVELSNLGMNVSVFTIPPNPTERAPTTPEGAPVGLSTTETEPSTSGEVVTTLPKGPLSKGPSVLPLNMSITAEYRLDGGAVQEAWSNRSLGRLENGVECIWKNLDLVPKNTKLLTFTITEINGWEGPWEFKIPLE
ncbi:MAG: hypothetical protein V1932_05575 [Chloroflexota bacterium]